MDNEYVKKLTGKNPKDYEVAAAHIISNSDTDAFAALVDKSDFLFDFIKENVKKRLANVVTNYNYKNLLGFLKIYSPDYEEFIVSTLVKFADEDLTDEMINRLEGGTDEEKAYAAKYFTSVNDTLAIDLLRKYSYSEFSPLALNCAGALSAMNDSESYNLALEKIKSDDEFEKLSAVSFLVAYHNKDAIPVILEAMKKSSMPENIASEIPYLQSFMELLNTDYKTDVVLAVNYILNGLGEIISLDQVFSAELYDVLAKLIDVQFAEKSSKIATVLLTAKLKFDQLTENDEYIFDEDKIVKEEVYGIKELLNSIDSGFWQEQQALFAGELKEESNFVFAALELVQDLNLAEIFEELELLLNSSNQTIILKTVEIIKSLGKLNEINRDEVLTKVSDGNIRAIIEALF